MGYMRIEEFILKFYQFCLLFNAHFSKYSENLMVGIKSLVPHKIDFLGGGTCPFGPTGGAPMTIEG